MKKENAIELRKKVQNLAAKGMKKLAIAKTLQISRPFINKWINTKDINNDKRGWKKGKKRKYTDEQEEKIIQIRKELAEKFFLEQLLSKIILVKKYQLISSIELSDQKV
jgi:transposase